LAAGGEVVGGAPVQRPMRGEKKCKQKSKEKKYIKKGEKKKKRATKKRLQGKCENIFLFDHFWWRKQYFN